MAAKSLMRENFSDDAKESVVPAESFLEEIKRYLAENESINFDQSTVIGSRDEYWAFIEGQPVVDLKAPSGATKRFCLGPGDMVACVRGIEHTLRANHELVYYQYSSVRTGGERSGHLVRDDNAQEMLAAEITLPFR